MNENSCYASRTLLSFDWYPADIRGGTDDVNAILELLQKSSAGATSDFEDSSRQAALVGRRARRLLYVSPPIWRERCALEALHIRRGPTRFEIAWQRVIAMFGPQVHSASSVTQEGAILEQTVRTLKHKTTLAMAKDPTPTNNDDSAPPRFLTVDPRAPAEIRRLLEEADGCQSMGFITGGTACARRAIDAILETEQAAGDDYAASLLTLSEKHPAVAPALFQILGMLGEGDEPLDADSLKALIVTIKAVVYEIYVLGAERIERLMYVHQLVESLKRDAGAARKGAA